MSPSVWFGRVPPYRHLRENKGAVDIPMAKARSFPPHLVNSDVPHPILFSIYRLISLWRKLGGYDRNDKTDPFDRFCFHGGKKAKVRIFPIQRPPDFIKQMKTGMMFLQTDTFSLRAYDAAQYLMHL